MDLVPSIEPQQPDLYVILAEPTALPAAQQLIGLLATLPYRIDADFSKSSLGAQLKAADKRGARYALILGLEESATSSLMIRNLRTGEQLLVSFTELATYPFV